MFGIIVDISSITVIYRNFLKATFCNFCKITVDHHDSNVATVIPNTLKRIPSFWTHHMVPKASTIVNIDAPSMSYHYCSPEKLKTLYVTLQFCKHYTILTNPTKLKEPVNSAWHGIYLDVVIKGNNFLSQYMSCIILVSHLIGPALVKLYWPLILARGNTK